MDIVNVIQGSPEWLAARAGSLGASQINDAIAKTKTGWGASRANIKAKLVAERLTGQAQETFTNAAMEWGKQTEAEARAAYSFLFGHTVEEIGLALHPHIKGTHASPDGLVGSDGLVEIKCPNTATHIDTLKSQTIPSKYVTQMLWQMRCCGRDWCDFVSYDPRLPDEMRIFVKRLERDNDRIEELEILVSEFLKEVEDDVDQLNNMYRKD